MEAKPFEPQNPVDFKAYSATGGRLIWQTHAESESAYAGLIQAYQELLDRGMLARVDILYAGTLNLVGCLRPRTAFEVNFQKYV